jgi:hypothetical protein
MNKIPLVQDFIFEFFCEPNMCKEYLNKVYNDDKINFTHTVQVEDNSMPNSDYGYPIPKDEKLFDWFQECIDQVSVYRFGVKNQTICDAWMTKTTFTEQSAIHAHSHSIFSGLLYLNESKTETIFHPEDFFYNSYSKPKIFHSKNNFLPVKFVPKVGTLLIFPSYLKHKIAVHKEKTTRYTLAFNTFFDGTISELNTYKLSLNLNKKYFGD